MPSRRARTVVAQPTAPTKPPPVDAQVSWAEFKAVFDEDDDDDGPINISLTNMQAEAAANAAAFESDEDD